MAKQLLIRPMQTSDLDAVLALQGTIYPSHYHEPRTVFASKLALAAEFCFVVTRENTLMGYLFAHPWLQTPRRHCSQQSDEFRTVPTVCSFTTWHYIPTAAAVRLAANCCNPVWLRLRQQV
jgi:hypothetical protein